MRAYPHTLSLITTHQCTAACDHCCFGCSPRVTKRIPADRLERLIDEAAQIPTIGLIGFTGGECFLLGPELDRLVGRASAQSFATRCISNGYWAVNRKAAIARIAGLRAAGLVELVLSTGTFHARFVPTTRVVEAAKAALEVGIDVMISVEVCDQTSISDREFALNPVLAEYLAAGRLSIVCAPWIPDGAERGVTTLSHAALPSAFADGRKSGCQSVLNIISVTPDLDVFACCGLTQESIPRLRLGSVAEQTIGAVLGAAPDDFLKIWIHVEGPEKILEFVRRYIPDYSLPTSAHQCTSCLHLHSDQRALAVLSDHFDEVRERVMRAYAEGLAARWSRLREEITVLTARHSTEALPVTV